MTRIMIYNVKVGRRPAVVRKSLESLLRSEPDAAVLSEAYGMYGNLGGLGYQVHHARPAEGRSEASDVAVLVRDDHKILRHNTIRLTEDWRGPKAGKMHDPREYKGVGYEDDDWEWNLLGVHGPFGRDAVKESNRAMRRWLEPGKRLNGYSNVIAGDLNLSIPKVTLGITYGLTARTRGRAPNLFIAKGASMDKPRNLGNEGSDHPAWIINLRRP